MALIEPELRAELVAMMREALAPQDRYEAVDRTLAVIEDCIRNVRRFGGDLPRELLTDIATRRRLLNEPDCVDSVTGYELVAVLREQLQKERGRR